MKNYRIEIKWALLFVVYSLLWAGLERALGLHDTHIAQQATYTNFFALVAIAVYVLALLEKRNNFYGGTITFRQAFVSGFIMTAFITLCTPLTQWISAAFITPHYFANIRRYAVASGMMTQDAADAYFNLKNYMIQSVMFTPVVGIVTTIVVALLVQRRSK